MLVIGLILCLLFGVIVGVFAPGKEDVYASIAGVFSGLVAFLLGSLVSGGVSGNSIFGTKLGLYGIASPIFAAFFFTLFGGALVARIRKVKQGKN